MADLAIFGSESAAAVVNNTSVRIGRAAKVGNIQSPVSDVAHAH